MSDKYGLSLDASMFYVITFKVIVNKKKSEGSESYRDEDLLLINDSRMVEYQR